MLKFSLGTLQSNAEIHCCGVAQVSVIEVRTNPLQLCDTTCSLNLKIWSLATKLAGIMASGKATIKAKLIKYYRIPRSNKLSNTKNMYLYYVSTVTESTTFFLLTQYTSVSSNFKWHYWKRHFKAFQIQLILTIYVVDMWCSLTVLQIKTMFHLRGPVLWLYCRNLAASHVYITRILFGKKRTMIFCRSFRVGHNPCAAHSQLVALLFRVLSI